MDQQHALTPSSPSGDTQPESSFQASPLLRAAAMVVSFIFHPLWVPFAVSEFLLWVHRYELPQLDAYTHFRVMSSICVNTLILPLGTLLLLKATGFVQSIQLHSRQERIVPYMAIMIFYWWVYRVFAFDQAFPQVLKPFLLGNFIAIILVFLCNIFFKISAHATAAGSILAVMILLSRDPYLNPALPVMGAVLLSGLVLTSRLILNAHQPLEVYTGYAAGFISQMLAVIWLSG
ncbi:hypothetical protein BXY57_0100 [Thermoflavifilum aggregans]|uniref:PAP2 superfamily protein n=1 Tax=Thermoflavifilum aggregans TaxID=454188 RepID=A0A2M9CRI5_9BACT|nr:hypothetical protein [Thermoflavifilum aggregans]MBX6380550.1 hypothetical protein [Thermoflavifilum aggregans]PJJ74542.1 hypothetical protein BXY57_0100 [Thermoflavifilum aggregans]